MSDLLDNVDTVPLGELLPTRDRDLDFRVTVRDGKGGVNSADMQLDVRDTGQPFRLLSTNTAVTWTGGTSETVNWDVAGTDAHGINAAQVEIRLSADGGLSFPYLLATVNNNGSAVIDVPNIDAANARLMVQGAGNVFFDVGDSNFSITADPSVPGIQLTPAANWGELVEGQSAREYSVKLITPPAGDVQVEVVADAETELSIDGVAYASTQTILLNSTSPATVYVRALGDQQAEGPWRAAFRHQVIGGTSADYPVGMLGPEISAFVTDLQSPPVVGIDFDAPASSGFATSPPGWLSSHLGEDSSAPFVFNNMTRDDGLATPFDLTVDFSSGITGTGWHSADAAEGTKPSHLPSLAGIGGYNFSPFGLPLTATWSDLTPGRSYGVYVLGLQQLGDGPFGQTSSSVARPAARHRLRRR